MASMTCTPSFPRLPNFRSFQKAFLLLLLDLDARAMLLSVVLSLCICRPQGHNSSGMIWTFQKSRNGTSRISNTPTLCVVHSPFAFLVVAVVAAPVLVTPFVVSSVSCPSCHVGRCAQTSDTGANQVGAEEWAEERAGAVQWLFFCLVTRFAARVYECLVLVLLLGVFLVSARSAAFPLMRRSFSLPLLLCLISAAS